jgi:hypothetical protein
MSEDTGNGARQTQVATKATKSSPQAKDLELDWDNITEMIDEGAEGKIVEVDDEAEHKTVEVWVE